MDLGDAVYRAICRRSPRTEPDSFGAAVAWFVRQAGGNVTAAARLAGVSRRTFRDWHSGKHSPRDPERRSRILTAARAGERRARLRPGREKRLRAIDPAGITFNGSYNYDPKDRLVVIGPYMDPDTMNNLIDTYLSGAPLSDLRQAFADSVTGDASDFYPTTLAHGEGHSHGWSVSSIDWEGSAE